MCFSAVPAGFPEQSVSVAVSVSLSVSLSVSASPSPAESSLSPSHAAPASRSTQIAFDFIAPPLRTVSSLMELDLLTWNVDGLDERHLDLRSEAACLEILLQTTHPHVVCLQEVVARSFHAHFVPHFRHAGFHPFPARPPANANYFDAIFVREPLVIEDARREPFPTSRLGRAL